MEPGGGVVETLKGKCLLVTGATGFLAKIFVEKVLRVQPEVKKLYLLLRASDYHSAAWRLQEDIIGKKLFNVLKRKHGEEEFQTFIHDKVSPIPGDIREENLGIAEVSLQQTLWDNVDIVVHVAATTDFFERYDTALQVNVLGAKNTLEFAKKCPRIQLFLHVSTAYVSGSKEGLILEKRFSNGETLNGRSTLNIDEEVLLMEDALRELHENNATTLEEKETMRHLGIKRARYFGWPNTYVFTKAMGEMLLGQLRGNMPLVIIRPTIITSIYNDPFPGWMEGVKTIDSFIAGYAKGRLSYFLVDLELIMDLIPGDMVSNAMIVAIAAHINEPVQHIYHVGSSIRNPIRYSSLLNCSCKYFKDNPQYGKDGKVINLPTIKCFSSIPSFQRYMILKYKLPLEGLRLVNTVLCQLLSKKYNELDRMFNLAMHVAEIYGPFSLFKGWFDDANLEKLRRRLEQSDSKEEDMLLFDPKIIDWDHYLTNIHIPGILNGGSR